MDKLKGLTVALLLTCHGLASADPIVVTPIPGGDDGGSLGGYTMTDFDRPAETDSTDPSDDYTCVASPISGDLCFTDRSGNPEGMDASDPWWWPEDHGNIYTADVSWVELILPANTRAFSFWVGASFVGRAWIEAFDEAGTSTGRSYFRVGPEEPKGYGYHVAGEGCGSIKKVIVEPDSWGMGNFSINQDPCTTQVSEPAPLALLGLGLLGIAIVYRRRSTAQI